MFDSVCMYVWYGPIWGFFFRVGLGEDVDLHQRFAWQDLLLLDVNPRQDEKAYFVDMILV